MGRKTHAEHVAEIAAKNPNVEILGEIINARTKVLCRCLVCHHEWEALPCNLKSGYGCPECGRIKRGNATRLPHAKHVADIKKANPNIEILEEIKNARTKVLCRCLICRHEWKATPNNIKHGYGCPACAGNIRLSHTEQVAAIAKVNPGVEVVGEIINARTKVLCRCKVCHYKWEVKPNSLKNGKGCPRCAKTGFLRHDIGKLYIMVDDLELPTMMKIGVSVNEDARSKRVLNSAHKAGVTIPALHVVKTWEGPTELMIRIEQMMHENYAEWNIKFQTKFDGCTEFFYYTPETAGVFDAVNEIYYTVVNQF